MLMLRVVMASVAGFCTHGVVRLVPRYCRISSRVVMEAPAVPAATAPARQQLRKSAALVREPEGVIEISLMGDMRVSVRGRVDAKALQAVLTALRRA